MPVTASLFSSRQEASERSDRILLASPASRYLDTAAAKAAQARWETFCYALPFILAAAALLVVVAEFRSFRDKPVYALVRRS